MEAWFFWLMIAGFIVTTLAATASYVLQEVSWHELEELCQQRRSEKIFGKIFDFRDQMRLGADILKVFATAVAACATVATLIGPRKISEIATFDQLSILALVAFGLILCSSWIPWGIERIAAPRFLFHTWRWWWLVSAIAWPFLAGGRVVSALFARASGQDTEPDDEEEAFEDEILTMVSEGEHDGFIEPDARDMIEGVMELDDIYVDAVMTPRSKIDALEIDTSWDEMLEFVVDSGRTRIPVYDGKIDNVVGLLYAKDLLRESMRSESKRRPLQKLLRDPITVPDRTLLDEMLSRFLKNRTHMAVVQDEYGGLAGVVTIEDVLEEIVGEIVDETDDERHDEINRINAYEADVDGTIPVNRLNEEMGLQLPEEDDFDTLSGLIVRELKEIPKTGRELRFGNVHLTVTESNKRSVQSVALKVVPEDEE